MARLKDRVALITGGGAGIGRAAALLFAREGATVAIAEIDTAKGQAAARAVGETGSHAIFVPIDVTDEASVAAAVARTLQALGRLDILFNCAGGSLPQDGSVTSVDMAVWERTIAVDLRGTFLACRHAIPAITAAGGGAIVNMSSGAALRGASPAHAYVAAKGAILSLTRALAAAHARDNIRVNAICAGRVLTERIAHNFGTANKPGLVSDPYDVAARQREYLFWVGVPDDIASIALFLASNESRMITGAAILADGGRSAY